MSKKIDQIYGHLAVLKLVQIVNFDSSLTYATKSCFALIAGYCSADEECYPSIKKIADKLCVSRSTPQKHIRILEEHGYLKRKARYHPVTRARQASIISLNCDLARQYTSTPDAFCRKNVTLVVTYLATLLYYRVCTLEELQLYVTPKGYTKKTDSIKQIKQSKAFARGELMSSVPDEPCKVSDEDRNPFDKKEGWKVFIKSEVPGVAYTQWIKPLELKNGYVHCPKGSEGWIKQRYETLIRTSLQRIGVEFMGYVEL